MIRTYGAVRGAHEGQQFAYSGVVKGGQVVFSIQKFINGKILARLVNNESFKQQKTRLHTGKNSEFKSASTCIVTENQRA